MIAFLLFLALTPVHSQSADLLDRVTSSAQIILKLKDLYRTYSINHIIDCQKDDINACQALNEGSGLSDSLTAYIKKCQRLESVHLSDPDVRKHVTNYLTATVQNYRILLKDGLRSVAFKDDYKKYQDLRKAYLKYVLKRFSLDSFIKLSGPEYWQKIDKKNYVNSARFEEYERLRSTNLRGAMDALREMIGETKDFQEWSIYRIELADDYVLHVDEFKSDSLDPFETAAGLYRSILDKKQYSLYLFEAWAKWRCVYQKTLGASKMSIIPNDDYERMREQAAETILRYVAGHPADEMAINEFIVLATHDVLLRFGEYKYGNQNAVEYKNLFGQAP
jgi:hypothetical protein